MSERRDGVLVHQEVEDMKTSYLQLYYIVVI